MSAEDSGYYILMIYIRKGRDIAIGKRDPEFFPRGWYAYAGSAMHGLSKRTARHEAKKKKMHWHIDYLLEQAELRRVFTIPDPDHKLRNTVVEGLPFECWTARRLEELPQARRLHARFGSGDCTCSGHLVYFPASPEKDINKLIAEFPGE